MESRIAIVTDVQIEYQQGKIYVDLALGPLNHKEGIQYRPASSKIISIPEEGDAVIIENIGDGGYVARMADTSEFGSLPLDLSEGDVYINAGEGDVYIGNPATAEPVATGTHTHDVTLSDGSSTTTGEPSTTTETNVE